MANFPFPSSSSQFQIQITSRTAAAHSHAHTPHPHNPLHSLHNPELVVADLSSDRDGVVVEMSGVDKVQHTKAVRVRVVEGKRVCLHGADGIHSL